MYSLLIDLDDYTNGVLTMEPLVYLNKPRLKQKLAEYGFDAVVGADSRNVTYLSDVRCRKLVLR